MIIVVVMKAAFKGRKKTNLEIEAIPFLQVEAITVVPAVAVVVATAKLHSCNTHCNKSRAAINADSEGGLTLTNYFP